MSWLILDQSDEGRFNRYFPHQHRIPREYEANLVVRKKLARTTDRATRSEIRRYCREDLLFWINTCCMTLRGKSDPRPVPFTTYPFQDEVLYVMWRCAMDGDAPRTGDNPTGQESLRFKKSRGVGGTWLTIAFIKHGFNFEEYRSYKVLSRKEDEVDKYPTLDYSSLLPKFDFLHEYEPAWLRPRTYRRQSLQIENSEQHNLIVGESTNTEVGRGGRYFIVFPDEAASFDSMGQKGEKILSATSGATNCRFFVSTGKGPDTMFARLGQSSMRQLWVPWSWHPVFSEGVETLPGGQLTSPWFRQQCQELGNNPVLIAQELLGDESQGGGAYYPGNMIETMCKGDRATVMAPFFRGEFDVALEPGGPPTKPYVKRLIEQAGGRWLFWMMLDGKGLPSRNTRYMLAIDTAAGSRDEYGRGRSNSVIAVLDETTCSIVAEFATHGMPPHKLAEIAVAVSRWFVGIDGLPAYMIWELNGPGQNFGDAVIWEHDRREQVYWSQGSQAQGDPKSINFGVGKHKNKRKAGFFKCGGERGNEKTFFGDHRMMLMEGRFIERSLDCVDEMRHYVYKKDGHGGAEHAASRMNDDPTGARENHGDRVITRCLLCVAMQARKQELPVSKPSTPFLSVKYLMEEDERIAVEAQLV